MNKQTPSVDFRLFQLEDRLQRLSTRVQSSLVQDILEEAQTVLQSSLTMVLVTKIDQFYKASQISKNKLVIEGLIESKFREMQPALKNNILKENKILMDVQFREIRGQHVKKKDQGKDSKQTMTAEVREKLEFLMSEVEDLHNKHKRNYEFTQNIQKLSYDRLDEMRHTIQLAVQELANTKTELLKTFTDSQAQVNRVLLQSPAKELKEQRLGGMEELSKQILSLLPRGEFEHVHLKQIQSQFQYVKDEIGALKMVMNNSSQYQRYITKTVERIQRFSSHLNQHESRRLQVQKLSFKSRIQKLQAGSTSTASKFGSFDKTVAEMNVKIDLVKTNLIDISSSQNLELKNSKQKLARLQMECNANSQIKQQLLIPMKMEMTATFHRLFEQISSYQLIKGQVSLIKEELMEVNKALSIMDAKLDMFRQQLPRFQSRILAESDMEPRRSITRHGQSIDEISKTGARVKPIHNPFTNSRYSVKYLKSLTNRDS